MGQTTTPSGADFPVAPWPDFAGNPIRSGDRLTHPDGATGTVILVPGFDHPVDAWRVVYDEGAYLSRLVLQIGDKGMATVTASAVAALLARNAELEAECKAQVSADDVLSAIEDSAICLENWGELHEARDLRRAAYTLIADRDALAAENKALREDAEAFLLLE